MLNISFTAVRADDLRQERSDRLAEFRGMCM